MLKNPSPNDWLMYRGGYSGWSFSKQSQITPANVNQMQLKWMLAMNDGGTNETTPIVHNGVIFLLSSGNTVQAINAVTGEIIWQNNIGPRQAAQPGTGRLQAMKPALLRDLQRQGDRTHAPGRALRPGCQDRQGGLAYLYLRPHNPDEGQHGNTGGVMIAHGKAIVGLVTIAAAFRADRALLHQRLLKRQHRTEWPGSSPPWR